MFDMNDFINELRYLKNLEEKYEDLKANYKDLQERYQNLLNGQYKHSQEMLGGMLDVLVSKAK